MANSFGKLYKITSFGESHGSAIGVIIDGCPAGIQLDREKVQYFLDRRRPAQNHLTTQRKEADEVQFLSGLDESGRTLGTPIGLLVENRDIKKKDYERDVFRPSHADFTTLAKYGIATASGGGRASARETVARVAAAAIAEQILEHLYSDFEVYAQVQSIGKINSTIDLLTSRDEIDRSVVRCPDPEASQLMIAAIENAKQEGDSLGGVISFKAKGVPAGLGEPVFDKLEADLAKAMLSLPACKGFEIGSGFAGTELSGSLHNDEFYLDSKNQIRTKTNNSGGIQGGISNGETIYGRVAFKPTSSISKKQKTVDRKGQETVVATAGRHDPCVLPRAVPIVEAMLLLVLMDHELRHRIYKNSH